VPTYEYACKQCGDHLEVVQKFTDDALTVCPSCEGPLRKVFGSIGISFKGSGFYKNDSRSSANGGKKQEPATSEGGSSTGDAKPDAAKTDAPAAKADAPKADKAKSDKGTSTAAAS
jgi:putative FmdB family regulatory protein